jgi:rfaE bifunctional protein kinase chain/domain
MTQLIASNSPTESNWLEGLFEPLSNLSVAVFGDFCLDAYWPVESETTELSVETGLPVKRILNQRYSLGGAGNVVANLIDLGVGRVQALGVVGEDPFGEELLRLLKQQGAVVNGMVRDSDWQTMVYAKPLREGKEQNRFDFGGFNVLSQKTSDALLHALEVAAAENSVVILNQQVDAGVSTSSLIERINVIIAKYSDTLFLVDARHRPELYRGAVLKLNAQEAARLAGASAADSYSAKEMRNFARQICERNGKPVFLTRGEHGILCSDSHGIYEVPGIQVLGETDPVGAGDTVVSAIAAMLGIGRPASAAARLANMAAVITVQKLHTTGTATPAEILAVSDPDYIFEPELAELPQLARYIDGTEIEVIGDLPPKLDIQHCIFDHDGTISTLREGWERVMEPMMVRSILGPRFLTADASLFAGTTKAVREFIDRTTGIQTLVQMTGLVEMVRKAGYVPRDEILDEHGYKRIYNDQLLEVVRKRITKLKAGELDASDFQIKNSVALLQKLHSHGVKLYLASGTDEADVRAEASALGYAHLFEGRMFGAVGNIKVEAKRVVLEKIISEFKLSGHQFATFGDGPVELRETRKRGGLCVGVASDELRRHGWNYSKRTRLVRAGATLIVPDFSQLTTLLNILQIAE